MRRWIIGAFAATVPAMVLGLGLTRGAALGGGSDYEVEVLSTPSDEEFWDWSYANDINDAGRIVGAWEYWDRFGVNSAPYYRIRALHWSKSSADPVELGALTGQTNTWAAAVNSKGHTCGYSAASFWSSYAAVVWDSKGKVTDRHPDLGYANSQMWDINQYGDCVGIAWSPGGWTMAFLSFANGDEEELELDTSTYITSWPYQINKSGEVVGFVRLDVNGNGGTSRAAYWDAMGDFLDLHDEIESDLDTTVFASKAWYVSDAGEVGGVAVVGISPLDARPFVWTEDDGFTWVDDGGTSVASVTGGGGKRLVGLTGATAETVGSGTGAVWTRGTSRGETVWNLDELPGLDGYGMWAIGVNSSGRVVGVAEDENGDWVAWFAEK